MSNMVFTLFGIPGSGKGTLAKKCKAELGFEVLSTGDLCRKYSQEDTELGKNIKDTINAGHLVSDEIISTMVKNWLLEKDSSKPIILDGYPRNAKQAELFSNIKKELDLEHSIIVLDIDEKTVVDRFASRLICSNSQCQEVFSTGSFRQAKKEGICDVCSSPLIRRADDMPEVVRERIKCFYKQQAEIFSYYSSVGQNIEHIDINDKTPDDIFEDFKRLLGQAWL